MRALASISLLLVGVIDAQSIAGYQPTTDVTTQNAIDLEQLEIEELLGLQTEDGFAQARLVYEQTFQGLSMSAGTTMRDLDGEFYPDFQKYLDYYGQTDFPNDFILNGFEGGATSSGFSGNFDFSLYEMVGRAEVVKRGTVYLILAQYVIRDLEDAIEKCEQGSGDSMAALDEAVAYYVGSLEGADGDGNGKLLHANADESCQNFLTCGMPTGISRVNMNIMRLFSIIQQDLQASSCENARDVKVDIARQLFVPFVQGTLRFAYLQSINGSDEKTEAQGVMNAVALLPMVYGCDPDDAKTVYNNMKPGQGDNIDFEAVKGALERNYGCMGILCDDIGGLWDGGMYADDADLCGQPEPGTPEPTIGTTATPAQAPTSKAPTTRAPTSKAPTTKAPASKAPTTKAPASKAPTTKAPTSKAPVDSQPDPPPSSSAPMKAPTTTAPTLPPVDSQPNPPPSSSAPMKAPTLPPVDSQPDLPPSSSAPIKAPTIKAPVLPPQSSPTTNTPTLQPRSAPTTKAPTLPPHSSPMGPTVHIIQTTFSPNRAPTENVFDNASATSAPAASLVTIDATFTVTPQGPTAAVSSPVAQPTTTGSTAKAPNSEAPTTKAPATTAPMDAQPDEMPSSSMPTKAPTDSSSTTAPVGGMQGDEIDIAATPTPDGSPVTAAPAGPSGDATPSSTTATAPSQGTGDREGIMAAVQGTSATTNSWYFWWWTPIALSLFFFY